MSPLGIKELIEKAAGRSIIIGEHHADRESLLAIRKIIYAAHEVGYRTLGVEVSNDGCEYKGRQLLGLKGELKYLSSVGLSALSEYDELSSLDPDQTGKNPRMNRYWQMQQALYLRWNIVSFDPHHWNWINETPEGYFETREPAMVERIKEIGSMVGVVGAAHLQELSNSLSDKALFVNAYRPTSLEISFAQKLLFAVSIPFITAEK